MNKKILIVFLFVLTLFSCSRLPLVISDADVIEFITGTYQITEPDSFRITKNIELLYYNLNRYYVFKNHVWKDGLGNLNQTWSYSGWGYIDQPAPTIPDVQMQLLSISIYLEKERKKLKKRLLNEN